MSQSEDADVSVRPDASFLSSEPLLALSRQSSHLQALLQSLLDAQSEGLLAGLGAGQADSTSSTGSRTPTTAASDAGLSKSQRTLPVRQPKPKKIGLRAARRGISNTMHSLSAVKASEISLLNSEIAARTTALSSIDHINSKTTGLRSQIETIESEPTNTRIGDLKENEKALNGEIHELETRLYEMKARQRHMLREIDSLENSVQSKLSSYKRALELAEKEAREFLARPPPEVQEGGMEKKGVWALPAQRRTLGLAREQWVEEQAVLDGQLEIVIKEKEALGEGAGFWREVVRDVSDLETLLQAEMRKLSQPEATDEAASGMRRLLKSMRITEKILASHLRTAEDKDWKLLVCCIGAELEALMEGRNVLKGAFEASRPEESINGEMSTTSGKPSPTLQRQDSSLESKSEDEGPGPELLVEHDDM